MLFIIERKKNYLNGSWCTRCRTMLADWMPNRSFLVEWPRRRDKVFKLEMSRVKRNVWFAYIYGMYYII